jgi:hypothetical protein
LFASLNCTDITDALSTLNMSADESTDTSWVNTVLAFINDWILDNIAEWTAQWLLD